jgi:hypothetical protein
MGYPIPGPYDKWVTIVITADKVKMYYNNRIRQGYGEAYKEDVHVFTMENLTWTPVNNVPGGEYSDYTDVYPAGYKLTGTVTHYSHTYSTYPDYLANIDETGRFNPGDQSASKHFYLHVNRSMISLSGYYPHLWTNDRGYEKQTGNE